MSASNTDAERRARLASESAQSKPLDDATPRYVRAGNAIYAIAHDRARYVPRVDLVPQTIAIDSISVVNEDDLSSWRLGPPIPTLTDLPRSAAQMRVAICRGLHGNGVEYSAGDPPFQIPADCRVDYAGTSKTEGIDIVDTFEAMTALAPDSVDFIIASHLINRIPDPVGAFERAAKRLRPGGQIVLIVADKTRTFDSVRDTTSVGRLLLQHYEPWSEAALAGHFEMAFEVEGKSPREAIRAARRRMIISETTHLHTFSFDSFTRLARAVCRLFGYSHIWSHDGQFPDDDPGNNEFFFVLTR